MDEPTLNSVREEIAEEREIAAEKARMERKLGLLRQLASTSEFLDKEIEQYKEHLAGLKAVRKCVKAIAGDHEVADEELLALMVEINQARCPAKVSVEIVNDPFAVLAPAIQHGGLVFR